MGTKRTISKTRSVLYKSAKTLGDVSAVKNGKIAQRVTNRVVGKVSGKLSSGIAKGIMKLFK